MLYNVKTQEIHLKYKTTRGKITNVYIGQVLEYPGITAYGKTKNELISNLDESIKAYFNAFPEEITTPIGEECVTDDIIVKLSK